MTINKGYLNNKYSFHLPNQIIGLLIWMITAYIFYAFFQMFREAFRIFTNEMGDKAFLVLSPEEHYLHNLFLAGISSALGYAIALRLILQSVTYSSDMRVKPLSRRALNSEGFWTWSFLLWFGKVGSLMGIWYLSYAMQYELDILQEFGIILLLLPIVLFYASWPEVRRIIGLEKAKWLLKITVIFLVMSIGMAFKNFIKFEEVNKSFLSRSIEYVHDLKRPLTLSHQDDYLSRHRIFDIYLVRDTVARQVAIYFDDINHRVNIQNIPEAISLKKRALSKWGVSRFVANLHIDERIPMKQINPIIQELRKADINNIIYSTGRKFSRYPAEYPGFRQAGIHRLLYPKYYPEFESYLDSIEQADMTGKRFKLGESLTYRNEVIKQYNRIEIQLTPDRVLLNSQEIEPSLLEEKVYGFIKRYTPDYVIVFNTEEEISYGRYIEYLDLIYYQLDRLRNKSAMNRYGRVLDTWERGAEYDSLLRDYPRYIMEWSPEEQRLNQLIKQVEKE